ncbi:hypothetical protein QD712_33265 [Streptomyces acidiscabies]|uniref:hypothetical protein n=1 Tax=Streptomyces acidiscabies TaxID=42234 RepID=UPI0030D3E39C
MGWTEPWAAVFVSDGLRRTPGTPLPAVRGSPAVRGRPGWACRLRVSRRTGVVGRARRVRVSRRTGQAGRGFGGVP